MLDGHEGQISIDEALEWERQQLLDEQERGSVDELERLGESEAYGHVILLLLNQAGWLVHVTRPFAGQLDGDGTSGIMVVAAHTEADVPDIRICGRRLADVAPQLLVETGKHIRAISAARDRREPRLAELFNPLRQGR